MSFKQFKHMQGSHPTWKTWNFDIFFSRPRKCQEFAQKVVKTWNLTQNLERTWNLQILCLKLYFSRCHLQKIIPIYFFVISTLSTQTRIRSQIDLGFHCFTLEITWKIHGSLCHKRGRNPASGLTHFKIIITKICMKVLGIWHKITWNLGPNTLWKPGIWYFVKSGNPDVSLVNCVKKDAFLIWHLVIDHLVVI